MTALLLASLLAQFDGGPTPTQLALAQTAEREFVDQLWDDGRHLRFGTATQGPVHVWMPQSYRRETAVTVVYLHGFYVDVDRAMVEYGLPTQFRDSGRNALFVMPLARSWRTDGLVWRDLEALLRTVERRAKLQRPPGPIVVVAHSGGYRTAVEWLKHPRLTQVVLLDGLYGSDDDFTRWAAAGRGRQLVLVGFDTQTRSDLFLRRHPTAVRVDDVPYLFDELTPAMRAAPVLYLQSERFDHMGLVTSGRLLPWLLHALR